MSIGKRTFQSAGQISQHLIPGAYSRIDSVRGSLGSVSVNNGVIMGRCLGGEPGKLLQFNTRSEAIQTLKGGDLAEAVALAFNPGSDLVPQKIYAMRVNSAVQSSGNFRDGSSNPMIQIKSKDYGLSQNQILIALESGSVLGKKVKIKFKQEEEIFDNIIRNSFTVVYSNGACTMTIVNNGSTHTLVTSVGGISLDLNSFPTIGDVVAAINNVQYFTATAIAGQEDKSSLLLDSISTQSIATLYTAQSTMQAIIDKINEGSAYVIAIDVSGANNRVIPTNIAYTYLTGGSEGSYTATEWGNCLTALEAEDVQFIGTPDSAEAVHAAIKAHCLSMSSVNGRKERQYFIGGAWGALESTAVTNAKSNNSMNGLYVYNGGTQYAIDGTLKQFGASYAACMLLGMACTIAINQPLTFKKLNFISLEKKLSNTSLENCIENGVCAITYNPSGIPYVIRQVTTYQDDDLKKNEFSMVREAFYVSRDLRNYLQELFVGKPSTSVGGGVLRGAVINRLKNYEDMGVFVKGSEGVAFWNVVIVVSGDTVVIDYDAYLTAPINFLFITNHFHEAVGVAA